MCFYIGGWICKKYTINVHFYASNGYGFKTEVPKRSQDRSVRLDIEDKLRQVKWVDYLDVPDPSPENSPRSRYIKIRAGCPDSRDFQAGGNRIRVRVLLEISTGNNAKFLPERGKASLRSHPISDFHLVCDLSKSIVPDTYMTTKPAPRLIPIPM